MDLISTVYSYYSFSPNSNKLYEHTISSSTLNPKSPQIVLQTFYG